MCVSCGVSFRVCMCVGLRVLWLPSVTCVGHVLSLLGWGRRRSRETAEHKGETQTGRQAAGRRPARAPRPPPQACSSWGGGSLGLDCTRCHDALVFNHVLPPIHTSLVPSLIPTPNSHPLATLRPFPIWFSLKSNLHPLSVASIHDFFTFREKKLPTLSHRLPPFPPARPPRHTKGTCLLGH